MLSPQTDADLLAVLEEQGCRITRPRRALAAFIAGQRGAFSAEEANTALPRMGRATVYRTLKLLVDAGALCKTAMPDGSPRYSLDDVRHHHHLVCVVCGGIGEFRHPSVERVLRAMRNEIDGELVGHRLEIYHRCSVCSTGAGATA